MLNNIGGGALSLSAQHNGTAKRHNTTVDGGVRERETLVPGTPNGRRRVIAISEV